MASTFGAASATSGFAHIGQAERPPHTLSISAGIRVVTEVTPNHALQRTRRERRGCNRCVLCAGSQSLHRRPPSKPKFHKNLLFPKEQACMGRMYSIYMLYMTIQTFNRKIQNIKNQLQNIGPMRPGTLTRQYRDPKKKIGPFWQLSHTYRMKSRTEYVRPTFMAQIQKEIARFKRFKKLIQQWIDLALKLSKLRIDQAKKNLEK